MLDPKHDLTTAMIVITMWLHVHSDRPEIPHNVIEGIFWILFVSKTLHHCQGTGGTAQVRMDLGRSHVESNIIEMTIGWDPFLDFQINLLNVHFKSRGKCLM